VILPDVNVLLYAFRQDASGHRRYKEWLEAVVNGDSAYGVSPQVLASVVRIATHPGIFAEPSTLEEALFFTRALLAPAHAMAITPGDRHWTIFDGFCRSSRAAGNLVQDAWFAALAVEAGCEWISTDADYARFVGLRWRRPF
jgi:toxin-antitoxin system PIN domain toxin